MDQLLGKSGDISHQIGCKGVLFGLPGNLLHRPQSVQNAAARLIFRIILSEHITPALISLHWLRVCRTYLLSIHGTRNQKLPLGRLVALVNHSIMRLDYGNSTTVSIPTYLMRRLQSALNAAALLICHLMRSDNVTDSLVSLYWLRVY